MWVVTLTVLAAVAIARTAYIIRVDKAESSRFAIGPDGIIIGAATIDLPSAKDATGVLLLHGGGDTPQVVADLAVHLHGRGFAVRAPLLAGHGRSLSALGQVHPGEWLEEVLRELSALNEKHQSVAVVGLSLGGALAVLVAAERKKLRTLVLLAPYLVMPARVRVLAATSRYWGWLLPHFPSFGRRSIHDSAAAARALGRGRMTPAALRALADSVAAARRALPRVSCPTLVIHSREDNRIAVSDAEAAFALLGSAEKELAWVTGAGHVITVDYGYQRVFEMTSGWIADHTQG